MSALNDPREYSDWRFNFISKNSNSYNSTQDIELYYNEILKRNWYVGCFSSDSEEALVTPEREKAGANLVEALYERGHSRPTLWAHYANNHKGLCLIFDRAKLDEAIRQSATETIAVHSGRVDYKNLRVLPKIGDHTDLLSINLDEHFAMGRERAAIKHLRNHVNTLFFQKNIDWSSEREYRWVVEAHGDAYFYVDIRSSLMAILVGEAIPISHKRRIGQYCLKHGVGVGIQTWSNGVPQPHPSHPRIFANQS